MHSFQPKKACSDESREEPGPSASWGVVVVSDGFSEANRGCWLVKETSPKGSSMLIGSVRSLPIVS